MRSLWLGFACVVKNQEMARFLTRLGKAPPLAWVAAVLAALALWAAIAAEPWVAVWIALAAVAGAWALRESGRFVIAPREAEQKLAGLAELGPLLEALPDPALLVDTDNRIAGSNAAARAQMQFEPRGQFLASVLRNPDVLDAVREAVGAGVTSAVDYQTTAEIERHLRCTVAPINWGQKRAAMLVFNDQTARISTERLRADFLANASHELRTPLASLTLLIETIAGPARDEAAERDRFLKMMQVQAERMRRLIDDLLSLSRIEMDEHVPPSDQADLSIVASDVIDALAEIARERAVHIELSLPTEPVLVRGERFQLTQVIQNLVDNALKYSPDGGTVKVEVGASGDREEVVALAGRRWDEAGRIVLLTAASAANRSYAFVRVEDAGPGIARRFLPKLGGRFFRVERETGDERGGTGLGLAIVKHIVNRHRGGLLVESQPGRGSAFAVYLELAG